MSTFCIQRGHTGREVLAIRLSVEKLGARCVWEDFAIPGSIPVGTVEFCQEAFGPHRIDFYPAFLRGRLFRKWGILSGSDTLVNESYVKDVSAWKSDWETKLYPAGTVIPDGRWIISEPITLVNEWRYYVCNGYVMTSGWYAGRDEGKEAPKLDVAWPDGFSGAVDFGEMEDGFMALVEAHAPFACGWYGEHHEDYARWQAIAWAHRNFWLR